MPQSLNIFSINKKHLYSNYGLTLLEVLVALTLSAVVLIGLYSAINTVFNTEKALDEKALGLDTYSMLTKLFQKDIRTSYSGLSIKKTLLGPIIIFKSTNSLHFNSTRPVTVKYFIFKKHGKRFLMREEFEEESGINTGIRLLDGIEELRFIIKDFKGKDPESVNKTVDNEGITIKDLTSKIVKMEYIFDKKRWGITGGKLIDFGI